MYQNDPKRVLTPECRLSYCNLVTARAPQNGVGDPKFSVTLLIPKSNPTIKQELDAAMNAAAEVGVNAKWNGVRPARIESVVHDGDGVRPSGEPFGEECRLLGGYGVFQEQALCLWCGQCELRAGPHGHLQRYVCPRVHQLLRLQLRWQARRRLRLACCHENP